MTPPDMLLDLNVILDFLQDRPPHAEAAEQLFVSARKGKVALWISGDSPSTLFYFLERQFRQDRSKQSGRKAQEVIRSLLRRVSVAAVTGAVLDRAIQLGMADYEDAIQAVSALEAGVRILVTRDRSGYQDLPPDTLAVLAPQEALGLLGA